MNYVSGKIVDLPVGNTERAARCCACSRAATSSISARLRSIPMTIRKSSRSPGKKRPTMPDRPGKGSSSIDDYDVIFLGYPNWCGTMPMALWTFLENHDFSGKTIYPFCTHEGSGVGHSWKTSTPLPGCQTR